MHKYKSRRNSYSRLDVLCVGGGGGGRSAVEDGGDGGDSSFGNYLYAGGGKGGRAFGNSTPQRACF